MEKNRGLHKVEIEILSDPRLSEEGRKWLETCLQNPSDEKERGPKSA